MGIVIYCGMLVLFGALLPVGVRMSRKRRVH